MPCFWPTIGLVGCFGKLAIAVLLCAVAWRSGEILHALQGVVALGFLAARRICRVSPLPRHAPTTYGGRLGWKVAPPPRTLRRRMRKKPNSSADRQRWPSDDETHLSCRRSRLHRRRPHCRRRKTRQTGQTDRERANVQLHLVVVGQDRLTDSWPLACHKQRKLAFSPVQFQQRAQTRALTHRHSLYSVYGRRKVAHARYGFLAPVAVPSRSSTQSSHSFVLEVGYDEEAMAASWELLRTTGCAFHCQAASSELPFQYSQSLADASALQQLRDICREACLLRHGCVSWTSTCRCVAEPLRRVCLSTPRLRSRSFLQAPMLRVPSAPTCRVA